MARLGDLEALGEDRSAGVSNEIDSKSTALERVRSLVEPAVIASGCELWDVSLAGTPGQRFLRVYIDAPGGVDIDRCTRVSRILRPVLDEPEHGFSDVDLEVSSPGAERRLRGVDDYLRFIGNRVNVRFQHGDGEGVVEGPLLQVTDDALMVAGVDGRATEVPLGDVHEARLAVDFGGDDRPHRPGSKR
jgi:ribosome maturation factor RimP